MFLVLEQSVIAKNFAANGLANATPGQIASATSTNNFINFCKDFLPGLPLMNGVQVKTGSCNPVPMGIIAANTNMPSVKFVNPKNFATLKADTAFTIDLATKHIVLGSFVNAQENYFAAPQEVDKNGDIIGHTHVVIEQLKTLGSTEVLDPLKFAFFKGVNDKADGNGQVHVPVTAGLKEGVYRLSTINSAANHQPVLVSVAQHGSLDDAIYVSRFLIL
jgi:hypothetical protein